MIANPDDPSCRELVELVTDYLEDRLPVAVRTRFETHLADCLPCRVYLAQMRETVALAGRIAEETLPAGSKAVLMKAFAGWKRARGGEP